MFVSVVFDLISTDSRKRVGSLLLQYGMKKVMDTLYESFDFPLVKLGNLKKDISMELDMDDKLRIYQYPLESKFKISYIEEKKWKRLSIEQ